MDILYDYLDILKKKVGEHLICMEDTVEEVVDITLSSKLLLFCGNGGAGAVASHMAGEMMKGAGIRSVCLTDNTHILTSYVNDGDPTEALARIYDDLRLEDGSALILMSGSGDSPNILRAAEVAMHYGDTVVASTGYINSKLHEMLEDYTWGISINFRLYPADPLSMHISEELMSALWHIVYREVHGRVGYGRRYPRKIPG